MPEPQAADTAGGASPWAAIDSVSVLECAFLAPGIMTLSSVPGALQPGWAEAVRDVYARFEEAGTAGERDRALKWILALPQLLLRRSVKRGGKRAQGHAEVERRFYLMAQRELGELLTTWRSDVARARARRGGGKTEPRDSMLDRAVRMISEGEIARGVRLLLSKGLGDLTDDRILAQLMRKHPGRKRVIDPELFSVESDGPPMRLPNLEGTISGLRRFVGCGRSGLRNEHLLALVGDFAPAAAKAAVSALTDFGTDFVRDKLPPWFYWVYTAADMVAPVKRGAESDGEAPDVRPVSMGECLRRVFDRAALAEAMPVVTSFLQPQQLLVGVESGDTKLINGLRMTLDAHPDWVLVSLDLFNAFNEIERAAVLEAFSKAPTLRHLVPHLRAQLAPAAPIKMGSTEHPSAEGMQQGWVWGTACFCVGIHEDVVALDAAVGALGGVVRFGADDGFVLGPPVPMLWSAITAFFDAVKAKGLRGQPAKTVCYSPSGDVSGRPEGVAVSGTAAHYRFGDDAGAAGARGVLVFNVPFGEPGFVDSFMETKAEGVASSIKKVNDMLRPTSHGHHLWTVLYYSLSRTFDFWLRNSRPGDVEAAARRVDAAVLEAAESALGADFSVDTAELALRRLRLPVRTKGGGLRSLTDLRHAAFVGGLTASLPHFVDQRDSDGILIREGLFHDVLQPVMGAEAFAAQADDGTPQLDEFISGLSRTARDLSASWSALQERAGLPAVGEEDGADTLARSPLGLPVAMGAAHPDMGDHGQRKLSQAAEHHEFRQLSAAFLALPSSHRSRWLWPQLDAFSTSWLTSIPDAQGCIPGAAFQEVAAGYFFLPSPALRPHVGKRIEAAGSQVRRCDEFGDTLCSSILKGDGHRTHHDNITSSLLKLARESGIGGSSEVGDLFRAAVPERFRDTMAQQMRGKIPDLALHLPSDGRGTVSRRTLCEVKTLHCCKTRYGTAADGAPKAVDKRAKGLEKEYTTALRRQDAKFGHPADSAAAGPLLRVFQSHGRLRGLVFGTVAEASEDVHQLVSTIAHCGAAASGLALGAKTYNAAQGRMAWNLKRALGAVVWTSRANLLLDRMAFLEGVGFRAGQGGYGRGAYHRTGGFAPAHRATAATGRRNAARRDGDYAWAHDHGTGN